MKRIIVIFLLNLFLLPSVHSQREWFPIGAEWHFEWGHEWSHLFPSSVWPVHRYYVVEKDTVVEGKTCRLIRDGENNKEIVYEENGCVYYYFNDKFRKIYDMTVNEGDVVEFEFKTVGYYLLDSTITVPCRIEKISSKIVDGVELKVIRSSYTVSVELLGELFPIGGSHIYIEKVGSEYPGIGHDGIIPFISDFVTVPEVYYKLRCYHDSDIDYIANWWQLKNSPCDDETVSNITVNNANSGIKFYPNPVKDRLTVSGETGETHDITILLYDAAGKVVFEKKEPLPCEINMGHLVSGVYYIRIFDGTVCLTSNKLIKK